MFNYKFQIIMKKTISFLICMAMSISFAIAQKSVTIKAGTIVPCKQ